MWSVAFSNWRRSLGKLRRLKMFSALVWRSPSDGGCGAFLFASFRRFPPSERFFCFLFFFSSDFSLSLTTASNTVVCSFTESAARLALATSGGGASFKNASWKKTKNLACVWKPLHFYIAWNCGRQRTVLSRSTSHIASDSCCNTRNSILHRT